MANRLLLLPLLLSVTCPVAWAQGPEGAEFRVNSYTTGPQRGPAVASDATGNFVVVWYSGQDANGYGAFGQRFNAAGIPQGSEFQVNSYATGHQRNPAVASDATGNFVVVWASYGQDGSGYGVFGQRFNAAGVPQGSEFQVNSYTGGPQRGPAVASDATGNFVVVWYSYPQDGSGSGVFGQRFNAAGVPQGSEFRVNSYTTSHQLSPSVAADATGNFVVVWQSYRQEAYAYGYGVFGQRFDAAGVPQGSEFRVNSFTENSQAVPAVASDANGSFVVVWQSYRQEGYAYGYGVFGQRFNAAGISQGSEFRVNSYTTSFQVVPTVAADVNGNFVVVWYSFDQDGSGHGVFGQSFDAAGLAQGGEFRVNSHTENSQAVPAVASDANGSFVVVWQSYGQDGSGSGVFGQRFGDLIFKDGFE